MLANITNAKEAAMTIRKFVFLFTFLIPAFMHAGQDTEAAISRIIANHENCVKFIDEEKVYLEPDAIFYEGNEIYIQLNSE